MGWTIIGSERAKARFDREGQITARVEHQTSLASTTATSTAATIYYAMELVDRDQQDCYLQYNPLTRSQTLELMDKVCQAVQHAHWKGVIHCELKLSNSLVTADGVAK